MLQEGGVGGGGGAEGKLVGAGAVAGALSVVCTIQARIENPEAMAASRTTRAMGGPCRCLLRQCHAPRA
jgi:hypothetical protein